MTDIYTQENGSKKKFLAPVLVILLCMVSLTAAGYAYSATVDNTGNTGDLDGVTMDLTGSFQPNGSMYAIADLDLATHTTNGKAVWYNGGKAFDTNEAYTTYTKGDALTGFKAGYYVEMISGTTSVGYHADSERTTIDFTANASTLAGKGVFKVGGDFTLTVKNKTEAAITLKGDITGFTDKIAGIADVYIVVKDGETVLGFVKLSDGEGLANIGNVASGAEKVFTVQAYLGLTDFFSGSVPTIPADAYTFDVSFAAATA